VGVAVRVHQTRGLGERDEAIPVRRGVVAAIGGELREEDEDENQHEEEE
jgi:hypothetical protein